MARELPSIPRPTTQVPKAVGDVLSAMRDILETRFLGRRTRESAVTVKDLIDLGLISESDLTKLGD